MKIRIITLIYICVLLISISCDQSNIKVKFNSAIDTVSYLIGVNIGNSFKSGGFYTINSRAVVRGIQDVLMEKEFLLNTDDADRIISEYLMNLHRETQQKQLEEGLEFLEKNKSKEGIITLPSGLQYKVLREGTGLSPKLTDKVTVHYQGTLIDGTVFDSSFERGNPIQFSVNGVISGWTEALQLMKVGAKWKLFIPSELAYGSNPPPGSPFEPNMVLIFELELLSIEK